MGSFCTSGNTVNQSQTYTPNPYAFGAISNALQQGQQVAQTPFQTPVAPVAGFSNDQNQAFQGTRNAQGMAQPYIDQAQNYFAGNNVSQFYNPMAANVMAGLKDVFGEQQQQITGNLQQQAGGVGADRIAIGQADLAKQQGLAAGQTLSGLYQNALQASQNAGFGIGALGPVAQNAALQGSQALLGTGGLQQQLQQAQMNAPYQNQLARIQWPYQNAQFNANITGALAPGLGGTTAGQTTYPQQSPLGTIAGLGMAGAGIAGQAGMFGGLGNMYNGYNYDGSMSGAQWAAAGQGQGPYAAQARGGRINPYASGGGVDDGDDAIHSAEVKELQDEGNQSNGFHMPQGGGGVHPINVAAQSLIPSGQVAQIKPNIPQLPNPSQSGSGGGSGGMMGNLASIAKGAAAIAPFFLARGGAVDGYAEGGGTNPFDPSGWAPAPEMPEEGESFGHFFMKANPFEMAMRGLKPSGIRLAPNANPARDPTFQVRGRFTRHGDTAPLMRHPATQLAPALAGGDALLATRPQHDVLSDAASMLQETAPASQALHPQGDSFSDRFGGLNAPIERPPAQPQGDSFADRFGGMAEPTPHQSEMPSWLQSGMQNHQESDFVPPSAYGHQPQQDAVVPIPRSNPFAGLAIRHEMKKRQVDAAPPEKPNPFDWRRHVFHMADGGEVGAEMPEQEDAMPMTRRQAALSEADPFERAAMRTRESVRPTAGRAMGPMMGAASTALMAPLGPEALLTRYAPRAGAALYGALAGAAPTEAGENDFKWSDPNADRAKRLDAIDAAIALESGRKTASAPGTQKARIDSLAKEKEALIAARGQDYNLARDMWQKEQDRLQEEAQKRKEAETSLFDKVPGTRAAITAASPAVSFLGGKFLGRRMSPWASVPIGGTAGAIEGAASIAGPTEMDINSLPRTSPTRQEAEADLDRKSYWQRVGLAAGVSGAAGMLGATKGYASTRPILSRAALPDAAEKAVEIAKQPAKKATVKPTVVKLPDGSTVHKFDYGNRVMWRDPTTKKLVKAPNTNQLPAPTSAPPAQIQATGGRVNPFARGGEVDWGDGTPTEGWGAGDNPDWSDVVERQNSAGDPQRRMDEWGANYRRPTIGKFPASPSPNPPVAPDLGYEHAAFKPTQEVYGRKLSGDMVGYAPADDVDRVQAGHDGEEQGVELPSRKAAPDVNPYDARAEDTSAKPQAKAGKQSFIDSPWMALVNAGLGTLAAAGQRDARGLPMSPAAAIGHGGQQGIKTLQEQQAAGLKRMTVEQRAKQLEAEAARHLRQMGETERHNKAIEGHQKELTDIQKSRYGTGLFDPETVTMMAHQAMQGDKSVFANLGRGVSGPQNIVSVRNEMNRLAKERGYSGADIAALNANFSAQSAAARSAAVREANISTAVEEAKGTFPLALHASEQLPRTDFVPINKMIQAWRSGTSTPAQAQFAIAHQGVITAYSQAMSRTGVNTVHAQQRAEDAFSQVQNHPSYQAAIEQLEKEMDIAKRAPETARQMILDRISGKKTEEKPAAAPSSTTKLTPQKRQEALDWAKSNPSDPRAARIIKEFGGP